jgi:hypothetical protein
MKLKFIGGPEDGQVIDVPDDRDHYAAKDVGGERFSFLDYKIVYYRRMQLASETKRYDMMVLDGWDSDDLILNLLRNYNP